MHFAPCPHPYVPKTRPEVTPSPSGVAQERRDHHRTDGDKQVMVFFWEEGPLRRPETWWGLDADIHSPPPPDLGEAEHPVREAEEARGRAA